MTVPQSFSCGLVQAPFVTSSGLLPKVWGFISSRHQATVSSTGINGLLWKVYEDSGVTFVVFYVNRDFDLQQDLVSSVHLKKTPDYSVNKSAIDPFYDNLDRLDELKSKIGSSPRLIITGHGLGGPIASLFTLSLLGSNDDKKKPSEKKKPPLCITFGSPLVGDKKFQQAISSSSTWSSCFLHVVSLKDPLPKRLSPQSQTNAYIPFGTFLFCSDISSTCFENPKSVLELLLISINDQNQEFQANNYGNIVGNLHIKAICKDFSPLGQGFIDSDSLRASIRLQLLAALGLKPDMQQQHPNIDINTLVTKLEKLEKDFIGKKRTKLDPSKKLNDMKIQMANLEWYKKRSKDIHFGYYDIFKKSTETSDQDVVQFKRKLTNYWKDIVAEVKMKPQTEVAAFRTRWLYGGNNYRRMVEPLDIAEYYRDGRKKDYEGSGRADHYKVLEELLKEDKKDNKDANSTSSRKNVELILTIDSCFWAKVEEALLQLVNVTENEEAKKKLCEFEEYVYGSLKKYEVSPEIFLRESSYMKWWNDYKGISRNEALARFMNNSDHYDKYSNGDYTFP